MLCFNILWAQFVLENYIVWRLFLVYTFYPLFGQLNTYFTEKFFIVGYSGGSNLNTYSIPMLKNSLDVEWFGILMSFQIQTARPFQIWFKLRLSWIPVHLFGLKWPVP